MEIGAGRGGKTTHLAQILAGRGEIVAVDNSLPRLGALRNNLHRMALTGVHLLLSDATGSLPILLGRRFDRLLIDAPCSRSWGAAPLSGTALATAARRFYPQAARLQQAILRQAAPYLASGGILLYITCTTAAEENEQVVQEFLDHQPEFAVHFPAASLPPGVQHLIDPQGYFRTLPERDGLDGFFAAALMKNG